ncbi:uncharacterized protein LOC121737759 [Aricia agestis]|uniref:uncharacterized protein LOC121737759 n=1 Tax=Aricia agestis TaxID=91739 RepID=UPI001C20BB43|nr:uncharacterized protein LOC121737759 [Aricia agestis]
MYTKYESAFYYKNPEIQLVINLQRIKDELGALLHVDHCDRCMGLKCKCLDVAIVDTSDISMSSPLANTTVRKDVSTKTKDAGTKTKDVCKTKDARTGGAWIKDAKDASSIPWSNVATKDTRLTRTSTPWTKDKDVSNNAKWSFKFSPLNIEEDIWRRADRYRRLEEKYLSSETVEEFFLSLRKRAVKCS